MGRAERTRSRETLRGIRPMLARAAELPADAARYGFEYKWDGMRCIAYCDAERLRLESRNGIEITGRFPELHGQGERLRRRRVVLDGEIVALDEASRPSFSLLQARMHLSDPSAIRRGVDRVPVVYLVFDVLAVDGHGVFERGYAKRRELLADLPVASDAWQTPGWVEGEGRRLLASARDSGLEGIVAKRLDSPYVPGERSGAWLKIKVRRRQEFIVAGYLPGTGRNVDRVGSLLLGYFEPPKRGRSAPTLRYAGNVGTGMSEIERAVLKRELDAIRRASSPFAGPAPAGAAGRAVVFAEPELVAEISYAELTSGGLLRHPVYHGLRVDKEPEAVGLERSA